MTRDHRHSRPLDVHKWSSYKEVNDFIKSLWNDEFAAALDPSTGKGNKPKQTPKNQFKVLILDLYVAWKTDPELCIGVGMSKSHYEVNSRYNALHISSIMIKVVHALHDKGYIGLWKGNEVSGMTTRIWPEEKLIKLFKEARWSLFDIHAAKEQEVIILNEKVAAKTRAKDSTKDETSINFKTVPIEYEDDDYAPIVKMREDLRAYNELLSRTFVDIGSLEEPVIHRRYFDKAKKKHVDQYVQVSQQNKLVRRVFYRGSWLLGGRFHGGFWQQIKSDFRKDILINDKRTVEIDYSGLHVSLAYALEGVTPPQDPYSLKPVLEDFDTTQQRKIVKQLALTALNANSRSATYQAFRDEQEAGTKERSLKNNELELLLDEFIHQNKTIEQYIGTDKGVELMALDGRITSRIINSFTSLNIPVLTIHDSYIVPEGHEERLVEQMDKATAAELNGFKVRLKYEVLSYGEIKNIYSPQEDIHLKQQALDNLKQQSKVLRTDQYKDRLNEFTLWADERGSL
ncbi:MAG: hypothetical protein P8O79_02065 [Halieaceae bacterium]|nr:hypothetical protein [Halieaceae bacterium]